LIHTLGYPRSGNTWLWRLLRSVVKEYDVIRTHMPSSPFFSTVVIRRDVRDVAVSLWKYRQLPSLMDALRAMAYTFDPGQDMYGPWGLHSFYLSFYPIHTTYEELSAQPAGTISRVLQALHVPFHPAAIDLAVEQNTFEIIHALDPHASPTGKVGTWEQYFGEKELELCQRLGWIGGYP
jgi:LPS sulfotransferase NodH